MNTILILIITCLAIGMSINTVAQTDDTIYTDGNSRFEVPIPADWDNQSTPELAHFVNIDRTANLYALAVDSDDVAVGIRAGLNVVYNDFIVEPVQVTVIPLPSGVTWTQNIYAMPEGDLIAALGRVESNITYLIIIRADQAVLTAETPVLNSVLLGHALVGQTSAASVHPPYLDETAFTEEEVIVSDGNIELPGTLALPIGEGPFPAVVIVHGSGPQNRDGTIAALNPYRDIAQGLASQGIATLRYDKRSLVAPEAVATIEDEIITDALAAVELLQNRLEVDNNRIFVIGHSLGGNLTPLIATQAPDLAGAVIMAGSPRPFDVILQDQIDYLLSLDPETNLGGLDALVAALSDYRNGTELLTALGGDEAQATYWESLLVYDAEATVQTLVTPLLFLQGERDYQVTMSDFQLWQSLVTDRDDVTFISYPELAHPFIAIGDLERMAVPNDYADIGFVDEQVITDIVDWINR